MSRASSGLDPNLFYLNKPPGNYCLGELLLYYSAFESLCFINAPYTLPVFVIGATLERTKKSKFLTVYRTSVTIFC